MIPYEFDKALSEYLAENSLVLTPVNVSFALGMDVEETAALMERGKLVLDSGDGVTATYRRPERDAYEASPGAPSVGKPISPRAINQMPLNFYFPGYGSLATLNLRGCLPVLALFIGAIVLAIVLPGWDKLFAAIPVGVAYLWSIVIGLWDYFRDDRSGKDSYLQ